MPFQLSQFILLSTLVICSCNEPLKDDVNEGHFDTADRSAVIFESDKEKAQLPKLRAVIDQEALQQVGEFQSENQSLFELYDQSVDEVEAWTDKMWGRCCTEADMRFTEFLGYTYKVDIDNDSYPFSNAKDPLFSTAFVVNDLGKNAITLEFDCNTNMYGRLGKKKACEVISDSLPIQESFELSLVNGYAKSQKTFDENSRIKEIEIWKNGEHMCNCSLLDTPKIQIIKGNFTFYKNDVIKLVPISVWPGSKYEDVCLSALQMSLGYSANSDLDKLSKHWVY
jgi:hypothetical protein